MGFVLEYPIAMYVDNIGYILLSENILATLGTKHIDMHHHFSRDYFGDKTEKSQFSIQKKTLRIISQRTQIMFCLNFSHQGMYTVNKI